ncbi:MAG: YIP1 family protein [Thermodesulfobacteriota bacterium]|nr:YIP1 family protein [Thermodesulfobacteriota bacterium]
METPPQPVINDFEPKHFLASLFAMAKAVLLSPRSFFDGMKTQGGFRNPLMFLMCCIIVHSLLAGLMVQNVAFMGRNLILGMVMPFVTAGLFLFFLTQFFRASGTFEAAFRVNAYAGAISLLSWLPLVGLILEFYRIYLLVVGLRATFSVKVSRAFLTVLMTLFTYMMLGAAIFHATGGRWPGAPS